MSRPALYQDCRRRLALATTNILAIIRVVTMATYCSVKTPPFEVIVQTYEVSKVQFFSVGRGYIQLEGVCISFGGYRGGGVLK